MTGLWVRVLVTVTLILLASLLADLVAGGRAAFTVAFSSLVIWICFQLWHLRKMTRWLEDFKLNKTPTGLGTWDVLFSAVFRLARSYERQQAQLKLMLSSFRSATEAMPDGVVSLDDHHQITYASRRAALHLNLRVPDDYGRNILNLLRHPDFSEYLEQGQWSEPVTLTGVPGDGRSLQVQLIPYGEREQLLLTRDVTEVLKLETTRRDFVVNVSHELKTPLTVISGFVETLQELPLDKNQRTDILETIRTQAQRMQRLIEDLLVLSRIESDKTPPGEDHLDMRKALEQLAQDADHLSRGKHQIALAQPLSPDLLIGDEQELASAFGNLVSNAIRYTPAHGTITLSWRRNEEGQGVFEVRDTGPGIEPEHIGRLTERFYRVDKGRSRSTGGTGLGLAIVKHIASRHNAHLRIESALGQGSRFALVFPTQRLLREPQTSAA
ncbi:MAG: phosphate regulon sensor histidine kinase PhoR [Burkholderiaceae bacterium]